jgi:hypothetical protein
MVCVLRGLVSTVTCTHRRHRKTSDKRCAAMLCAALSGTVSREYVSVSLSSFDVPVSQSSVLRLTDALRLVSLRWHVVGRERATRTNQVASCMLSHTAIHNLPALSYSNFRMTM